MGYVLIVFYWHSGFFFLFMIPISAISLGTVS